MTQNDRVLLHVRRFRQETNECAVASAASLANFYDDDIDYSIVRKMIRRKDRLDGLYTSQQARLLNDLEFERVSIVTSDLDIVDFSWRNLTKRGMINKLRKVEKFYRCCRRRNGHADARTKAKDKEHHLYVQDLIEWLSDVRYDNNLVIDHDYPKYIRKSLSAGHPVGASFNATSLFKMKKISGYSDPDVRGDSLEHAVIVRGYDENGVFIVDSDHGFAVRGGALKKYECGYYKLSWHKFLVNMPDGDLLLVD